MKILSIIVLLTMCALGSYSQSTLPLRADTVTIEKVGGSSNLKLRDATKDSTGGLYVNMGGGLLRAIKTRRLSDTSYRIGLDTIRFSFSTGPTVTADNGLTKTGGNIQWGGTLLTDIDIPNDGFSVFIHGTGQHIFRTTNGAFQSNIATSNIAASLTTANSGNDLFSEVNAIEGAVSLNGGSNATIYSNVYVSQAGIDLVTKANTTPNLFRYDFNGKLIIGSYAGSTYLTTDTSFGALVVDGSGNIWKRRGANGGGGGSGSGALTNVGTGLGFATTPNGSVKRLNPAYGINGDSTTTSNTITLNADTTELVTPYDLLSAIYIVGRNLRVISGSPDTLATKDTLISATPDLAENSTKVATTEWVKDQGYGAGGGATAAGSAGDIQFKNTNGGLSAMPGSYIYIDSTNKSLVIGNPSSVDAGDVIEIDTGNIDIRNGAYKIGGDLLLSEVGNTTRINEAAMQDQLDLFATGTSRFTITPTLITMRPVTTINTTLQIGGVDVLKDLGSEFQMGSGGFWRKTRIVNNGATVAFIDTARWGFNNSAPLAIVHITPSGTGQYQGGLILDSAGAPTPQKWLFYNRGDHIYWYDNNLVSHQLDQQGGGSSITSVNSETGPAITIAGAEGNIVDQSSNTITVHSPYTLVYSDTSATTIGNTSSQTSALGNVIGSTSFSGSTVTAGTKIIIKGFGIVSTKGSPVGNLGVDLTISNFTLGLNLALPANLGNAPFEYEYEANPFATGTNQDMFYKGKFTVYNSATGAIAYISNVNGKATMTTTGTLSADIKFQWVTADADNTLTSRNNTLEIMRLQ